MGKSLGVRHEEVVATDQRLLANLFSETSEPLEIVLVERVLDVDEIVLADEILTPDSSRVWPADQWVEGQVAPSFDKQYLRDWLVSEQSGWDRSSGANPPALPESVAAATAARYVEAYRRLTGSDPIL